MENSKIGTTTKNKVISAAEASSPGADLNVRDEKEFSQQNSAVNFDANEFVFDPELEFERIMQQIEFGDNEKRNF